MRARVAERLKASLDSLAARGSADVDGGFPGVGFAGGDRTHWPATPRCNGLAHGGRHGRLGQRRRLQGPCGGAEGRRPSATLVRSAPKRSTLLVDVALGSPAVCALRALRRVAPELAWDDPSLLSAAATVAWGFRTLFNQHEAVALLRRGEEDRYWHRVLTFSAEQNLQAVLDEYAHYLVDAQGLSAAAG